MKFWSRDIWGNIYYIDDTLMITLCLSGVAFMVGSLFMLMVGVEVLWGMAEEKYQEVTGKPQEPEKDPAALVGTFSRYK